MPGLEYSLVGRDKSFGKMMQGAKKETLGLDDAVNDVNASSGKISGNLSSLAKGAAGFFAAIGIGRFLSDVVATNVEFERMYTTLKTTLGSDAAASGVMADIENFATNTPFQVNEITDSYLRLVNRGLAPTKAQLTSLGDLASSQGKKLNQISEALLDAQTGEFERLKEFGIKAAVSGDKVAFTFKGVKTEVDKTDAAISDYIFGLGELEGVQGGMADQMETTGGKLSNLQDGYTNLKKMFAEELRPQIHAVIDAGRATIGWISDNISWLKPFVATVGIGVAVVKAWAVAQWAINAAMTANPIGLVIVGVAALTAGIVHAWKKSEKFRGVLYGIGNVAREVFTIVKETIGQLVGGFKKLFSGDIKGGLADIGQGIIKANPIGLALTEGKRLGSAFKEGYESQEGTGDLTKKKDNKNALTMDMVAANMSSTGTATGGAGGAGGSGSKAKVSARVSGGTSVRNVAVKIEKLVEQVNFNSGGPEQNRGKLKDELIDVFIGIVRDSELALG